MIALTQPVIRPDFPEVDVTTGSFPASALWSPALVWHKPPPVLVLDPYGDRADFLLTTEPRDTHATVLTHVEHALVRWSHCVLSDGAFYSHFATGNEAWARSVAAQPPDHPWRVATGLGLQQDRVVLTAEAWRPTRTVRRHVLLASADEPANWGLHLLNAVIAAIHFHNHRDRYDAFMCFAPPSNLRTALAMVGIADEDLIAHDVFATYAVDEVSTLRHTFRDLFVPPDDLRQFQVLAEAVREHHPPGPAKVYLSRLAKSREPGAYRVLQNEDELVAGLVARGYVCVDMEQLDPLEQIRVLASATHVVGLGGAGMFNTVFCRPGTTVVDIESTPLFVEAHTNVFASAGLRYAVVLGREDESDPRADHRRWRVDVPRTLSALDGL